MKERRYSKIFAAETWDWTMQKSSKLNIIKMHFTTDLDRVKSHE